ncbi:MAG: glucose-1-phosphate cytidylyltransferase, partial [Candidatus Altiarchaeum hamiconexum]|nr:glucose-1-phosphate cytidylyltransferase [Candidatus Altarchaeum hamiconexum]
NTQTEDWTVSLIDTGLDTQTGGRLKRVKDYISNETFMFTYGDGVANINIDELLKFHKNQGNSVLATMTLVQPPGKFGSVELNKDNIITEFHEKPAGDNAWINGGFFVLEPEVINYIKDDNTIWEREPLENLAEEGRLMAYKHKEFWKCMDTLRDNRELNALWESKKALWKIWND